MIEPGGRPEAAWPVLVAPARLALRVLSEEDVRRIHVAALKLLGAEGAAAETAASSAPSSFALAGRADGHDASLGAGRCWLATGGPAARVRPPAGGDPELATAADLDAACRLADALPEVAVLYGPPVHVAGAPPLAELAQCFAGTSKHLQVAAPCSAAEAEVAVEMATAVAGSEAARRTRPPLSLCGGAAALPAALVFARAGLPVGVVAPPGAEAEARVPGAAPDLATALVHHHAGVLAACATVQAAAPGAPFIYFASPALAGLPAAAPETAVFQIAAAQLAAYVGLPVSAVAMATGSHEPDWQACSQNALASLGTTAARADLTVGAGALGGGLTFSAQQLVMDSEIFSWNARIAAGITVDEETIALGPIRQVGIGGNYLSQRHTRRHMRDVWRPRLLDRSMWDVWVAAGEEGAGEKAMALAARLLAEHEVVPLGEEATGTLQRITTEAGLRWPRPTPHPEARGDHSREGDRP